MSKGFSQRHIGPDDLQQQAMLETLECKSTDELMDDTVPNSIRNDRKLNLPEPASEVEALRELRAIASQNIQAQNHLGMGYYGTITPPVILRNILENPSWYTQYTPYQAEIAQGRLEALLNFQTMVADLTGLEIANASLLDEGTAAAEAMTLSFNARKNKSDLRFFVADDCHEQSIAVVRTRAEPLGIEVVVGQPSEACTVKNLFGAMFQYPNTYGSAFDYSREIEALHAGGALVTMATDLLSLALLKSPGEMGADIAIGSSQRFGVPMGFGGPHAAFFATKDEHKRRLPGRLVGVSKDRNGKLAVRLALQTREQHIRRDKATSNICTAQVLLAIMSGMYAVYHGPKGLKKIATDIHSKTAALGTALAKLGYDVCGDSYFDTLKICDDSQAIVKLRELAQKRQINLRFAGEKLVTLALDETTDDLCLKNLLDLFAAAKGENPPALTSVSGLHINKELERKSAFLSHAVFNSHHTEAKLTRYIKQLENRDLSLTHSMIPLGSCTMKLNATSELIPVTWPEFGNLHPAAPLEQAQGYQKLFSDLECWLAEATGFDAVSLQPNSGAQGEYAGLLTIRSYHLANKEPHRNICLIPTSAHGTNPASAVLAGMQVVPIKCNDQGDIDLNDLRQKCDLHKDNLAALMVTYPSTHGVFETGIREICEAVHKRGGQVYMDGANMNAQIGLCRPGEYGPDVCHLNLHKTFCIPHGGGGPGMGPICVKNHLKSYLPNHPWRNVYSGGTGPVSAAPWGSPSILPISWMYIRMMGANGLREATKVAILNANYIANRLEKHFPVLFRGEKGRVAHECIVDLRKLKTSAGIEAEDVAKRLIDYGFHAPTMSWPVAGTMMIEPTESEDKEELDRFCDAMIAIRAEIKKIESGQADRESNVVKNAPHTAEMIASDDWNMPYTRNEAVYPLSWVREKKFWPAVGRIDNAYGDRNLVCSCEGMDAYQNS